MGLKLGRNIALGAGGLAQESGWTGTDKGDLDITNRKSFAHLWKPQSRERFVAEHVWEHLTPEDAKQATANCFEFLQRGGRLRIAVPDGNFPDQGYIDYVKPGGTGAGADDHKVLWTAETLERLLRDAGFETKLLEWWDKTGIFHAEFWESQDGHIRRSKRFDERNRDGQLRYTSLIMDGIKP